MGHFAGHNISDAPEVGHPVGCPKQHRVGLNRDMFDLGIDIAQHLVSLEHVRNIRIDGKIHAGEHGTGVEPLESKQVSVLGKPTQLGHPEDLVHSRSDFVSLFLEWRGILADQFSQPGRQSESAIVISRGLSAGAATVVHRVADQYVSKVFIKSIFVRIKATLLPVQMINHDVPHFAGKVEVARPQEMPHELIHVYLLHVVGAAGICFRSFRNVAPSVQNRIAGLPGKIILWVSVWLPGDRFFKLDLCKRAKMGAGPIMPAELTCNVCSAPAKKRDMPPHSTV